MRATEKKDGEHLFQPRCNPESKYIQAASSIILTGALAEKLVERPGVVSPNQSAAFGVETR